ncbi:Homeodomain-like [Phytophthora cactorum]|nr:Homeodomain-like [Phytophthora cactorum]
MEVLITWLTTLGNAERLRREKRKDLIKEIIQILAANGIQHRAVGDVHSKIWYMETQFTSARALLIRKDQLDAFQRGEAGAEVTKEVLKLCPQYRELVPVFGEIGAGKEEQVVPKNAANGAAAPNGAKAVNSAATQANGRDEMVVDALDGVNGGKATVQKKGNGGEKTEAKKANGIDAAARKKATTVAENREQSVIDAKKGAAHVGSNEAEKDKHSGADEQEMIDADGKQAEDVIVVIEEEEGVLADVEDGRRDVNENKRNDGEEESAKSEDEETDTISEQAEAQADDESEGESSEEEEKPHTRIIVRTGVRSPFKTKPQQNESESSSSEEEDGDEQSESESEKEDGDGEERIPLAQPDEVDATPAGEESEQAEQIDVDNDEENDQGGADEADQSKAEESGESEDDEEVEEEPAQDRSPKAAVDSSDDSDSSSSSENEDADTEEETPPTQLKAPSDQEEESEEEESKTEDNKTMSIWRKVPKSRPSRTSPTMSPSMSPKRTRTTYQSALSDNMQPGGPTTMDVLMHWLTTPGNVKRWRLEPRAPLVREVVEMMQEEGLAHRQAPFVRYKLDAIEKQYITAQKWLLETGMHDAFMRGKATKEVRAHVDHVCPMFKKLDPAFRGVPFSKKHAETIDLDNDSAEDVETEEKQEEESEDDQLGEEKTAAPTEKGNTFRDRLFPQKGSGTTKEKPSESTEDRQKKARAFRDRLLAEKDAHADKEKSPAPQKKGSRLAKQIAPSPGYAAARKSLTTAESQEKTSAAEEQLPASASDIAAEKEKTRMGRPSKTAAVASSTTNGTKDNTNAKKEVVAKTSAAKRKSSEEDTTAVKRNRTHEQVETDKNGGVKDIEREALLKRVSDEEKQRHEMYELERVKVEYEVKSKRVQLLFETAAAPCDHPEEGGEPAWTQRNLALWAKETFGLESKPTQATISNLLRDKDKLLSAAVPPDSVQREKRMTRSAVQTKAVEVAQEMQVPSDMSFSKGWVSSFMSRHQLDFSKQNGDQESPRQNMPTVTTEAVNGAEQVQVQKIQEETDEEEEVEETDTTVIEVDNSVEVDGDQTEEAAHTWLRQARLEYPLNVANMTLEQDGIKSHVLQMCPHYERLVSVLAPYVNYDDSAARAAQRSDTPATAAAKTAAPSNSDSAPLIQSRDTSVATNTPPKPAKSSKRQSTESNTDDSIDDETKAQKRHLFELECARLQSEIETRNIQLVLEKTLARKKLLDAGEVANDVKKKLAKMCPYYEELAAVFRGNKSREQVPTSRGSYDGDDADEDGQQSPNLPPAQSGMPEEVECDSKQHFESHTRRLLDVEFECKTIQLEAATICDVALSRKKMLDAGIDRDEVDRLLPQ